MQVVAKIADLIVMKVLPNFSISRLVTRHRKNQSQYGLKFPIQLVTQVTVKKPLLGEDAFTTPVKTVVCNTTGSDRVEADK